MLRSPEGMQVLSLVTGEPKATLQFPPDRSVYLDMDNDGHLEKLVWDLGQVGPSDRWRCTLSCLILYSAACFNLSTYTAVGIKSNKYFIFYQLHFFLMWSCQLLTLQTLFWVTLTITILCYYIAWSVYSVILFCLYINLSNCLQCNVIFICVNLFDLFAVTLCLMFTVSFILSMCAFTIYMSPKMKTQHF